MSINNLPSSIQSVIQQGYLERAFEKPLKAKLGFRSIAEREDFPAGIGETITKTRTGLLPAITTPQAPAANSDITSGMTPQNYGVEQYTLSVAQYPGTMQLNVATSRVAIDSLFLRNAMTLSEQAARSVDTLAQMALFAGYLGGNTFVRVTLGAAGTTISVDDIRGFQYTWSSAGQVIAVSSANPVNVVVGSDVYQLVGASADAVNASISPGGVSGTLTFSGSVTVADGTVKNAVISAVAPYVQRPYDAATESVMATTPWGITTASSANGGKISMQMLLNAKAQLTSNGVLPVSASGMYHFYGSPKQVVGLFADPDFKLLYRGGAKTEEYRRGAIAEILGIELIETNLNPNAAYAGTGTIQYGMLCGEGALVEGSFTPEAYKKGEGMPSDDMITVAEGIAHITREPLDALKQVVTQSWTYIGGFTVPSDTTTSPTTLPTASNAAFKRGVLLESF
jgi:hypothetical protein